MKNLKLLILLFSLCALSSFSYLDLLNPFDNNKKLKGQVKYVKSINYYKNKKDTSVNQANIGNIEIEYYDKNGNILISKSVRSDSSYSDYYGKIIHRYNEKNKVIESKYYSQDSTNDFHMIYKYEPEGSVIERFKYNFDGSLANKTFYYYNDSLFVTLEMCLDSDNRLAYFFRYEYDKKGRVTKFIFHNERHGEGQTSSTKKIFKYDNKGRRIGDISFDINGNLKGKVNYYYNNKNQITKIASGTM